RTNLFLIPLDDRGEWYRFHQLFAQLLRAELEHREPALVVSLHRRAFAWHRDNGSVDEAIRHALEAGTYAAATDVIARTWLLAAGVGRQGTVLGWLEQFPPELSDTDPRILLMKAWMYSLAGERREAAEAISVLERTGWSNGAPLPDGSPSLEASLATLRACFAWDDVGAGYENALRAAELQTPGSPQWAGVCWALGMGCYYRGELDEADRWFAAAVEAGSSRQRWLVTASALAYRSLIAGGRARPAEQQDLADAAAVLARDRDVEEIRGEVDVALGVSLAVGGKFDQALPRLAHGVAVLRPSGGPIQLANALIHQAAVLHGAGRLEQAEAGIAEARAAVDS